MSEEFFFCWKVSSIVHVFKHIGEWSKAKSYWALTFLSVVSKIFGKLVNNRIVDHLVLVFLNQL